MNKDVLIIKNQEGTFILKASDIKTFNKDGFILKRKYGKYKRVIDKVYSTYEN